MARVRSGSWQAMLKWFMIPVPDGASGIGRKRRPSLYIGFTENIQARFLRHQSVEVPFTQTRRPLKLIHPD